MVRNQVDFWTQYSNELARAAAWGTILVVLAVGSYFGGRWYIRYRKQHAINVAKEIAEVAIKKGKHAVDVTVDTAKGIADKAKPVIDATTERARATGAIAKDRFEHWRGKRKTDLPQQD